MKTQPVWQGVGAVDEMPFDELLSLRERIDKIIAQRAADEEKELEQRLERIRRLKTGAEIPTAPEAPPSVGRKLPVRYRNPENPTEVWAGRGLRPRWLTKALKSGKKLNEFLVVDFE